MKFLTLSLFCALIPFTSHSAQITYTNKSATIFKNENIVSVLVNRDPEISVYIVADSLNCRIFTKTIDEALEIQTKLASDPKSWVQCYGASRSFENPPRIVVETDRYTLGQKLAD